ncbi:winged helix-turn-helix transcriptional regulator [Candidatus Peregrinibacteria bacterium]|jgi:predicted transcriptional regulator|nr:winged helix-turn-helix transcriptional regulator [Candidatus Peregrinibacteria bacterium]
MILKALFSSQTRIKLLKTFLLNEEEEFFIRQLTRLLDEQINSVRRELDNLKKIGFVRSRMKNRRKYFYINPNFLLFNELKNMFIKSSANDKNLKKDIENLGSTDLAIISGQFVNDKDAEIDLLIVGDVVSKKVEDYVEKDLGKQNIQFSVLTRADFDYRLEVKDSFILKVLNNPNNILLVNKMKKSLDKFIHHE